MDYIKTTAQKMRDAKNKAINDRNEAHKNLQARFDKYRPRLTALSKNLRCGGCRKRPLKVNKWQAQVCFHGCGRGDGYSNGPEIRLSSCYENNSGYGCNPDSHENNYLIVISHKKGCMVGDCEYTRTYDNDNEALEAFEYLIAEYVAIGSIVVLKHPVMNVLFRIKSWFGDGNKVIHKSEGVTKVSTEDDSNCTTIWETKNQ